MNCNIVVDNMPGIVSGDLAPTLQTDCDQHILQCSDCRDALRGAEALALLSARHSGGAPTGLFDRTVSQIVTALDIPRRHRGFWLGAGFGSAVAASVLALALALGWIGSVANPELATPHFTVALSEPRNMEIAIETDRALAGANISILLAGAVELDGYGNRRELSWTTDLEAGINRLSLPILAVDAAGGQVIVRLDHPDSEQVFVVQLKADA